MTCRGIVKNGKIEVEPGVSLPEGSVVTVELNVGQSDAPSASMTKPESSARHAAWLAELERLSVEIDQAWKSPKTALEILAESRR